MSEPIIIETPTTTRERLVLVPPSCVTEEYESQAGPRLGITGGVARDATPADLKRGGFAPLAEQPDPGTLAHLRADLRDAVKRAEKAERERDDLLEGDMREARTQRERADTAEVERDTLRAELARLTALDRATDDELVDLYRKIYETHGGGTISVSHDDCRRAGLLAVAAHVRKERCLVAQAVGMGTGVTISRTSERVPSTTGMWDVYVTRRPDVPGEHYAYGVPTADVPATLARLLGEVSRG